MSTHFLIEKVVDFFAYILCEKNELMPGNYNLKDMKIALARTKFRKYSWMEHNNEVHIKKKSIFFPASHYLALKIESGGLRCKIKINTIERMLLACFLATVLLVTIFTPFIALIITLGPPNKYDSFITASALFAVSVALMAWLKFICFTLSYISGVSKLAEWIRRNNESAGTEDDQRGQSH